MIKCELAEPQQNTIDRYLEGLKPSITNIVQLQPYWKLLDIQTLLAFKMENQHKIIINTSPFKQESTLGSSSRSSPSGNVKFPSQKEKSTLERKKSDKTISLNTVPTRKYFKCHGYGHIATKLFKEERDLFHREESYGRDGY